MQLTIDSSRIHRTDTNHTNLGPDLPGDSLRQTMLIISILLASIVALVASDTDSAGSGFPHE